MRELCIERNVLLRAIAGGQVLPLDHLTQKFAAGLLDWHPVKNLLTGEYRLVGENVNVLGFLCVISEVYADRIERYNDAGASWKLPQIDKAVLDDADAELGEFIPDDVIYHGENYSLRILLTNAREAIAIATRDVPFMRTLHLDAFNRAYVKLVRAIKNT